MILHKVHNGIDEGLHALEDAPSDSLGGYLTEEPLHHIKP